MGKAIAAILALLIVGAIVATVVLPGVRDKAAGLVGGPEQGEKKPEQLAAGQLEAGNPNVKSDEYVRVMRPATDAAAGRPRLVWIDPERLKDAEEKRLKSGQLMRLEYPGANQEIPWSNSVGGMDVQFFPAKGLVFRAYDEDAEKLPHFVSEVPVSLDERGFYRTRAERNTLRVPFLFCGCPSPGGEPVRLSDAPPHATLVPSYLQSPYDAGIVLTSKDALVLIRVGVAVQSEWVAVQLTLYNLYGPAISVPPVVRVRSKGGHQLSTMPFDQADKVIPDNPRFTEFREETFTGDGGMKVDDISALGFKGPIGVAWSGKRSEGSSAQHSSVHPLRESLIRNIWDTGPLHQGSWRKGLVLFKPPDSDAPIPACTVTLETAIGSPIAEMHFEGFLENGSHINMEGTRLKLVTHVPDQPKPLSSAR